MELRVLFLMSVLLENRRVRTNKKSDICGDFVQLYRGDIVFILGIEPRDLFWFK